MTDLLECSGVRKWFGSVPAVEDASLTLDDGEFLALLGPSGCGKTTLLRLIAGFERPDGGQITLRGRKLAAAGVHVPPQKRSIGLVFQDYALFPHLNVAKNVAFGVGRDGRKRIEEMLSVVGLSGLERRMPHELSGGQQQRVALARTLAASPDVVLLDEPFSNLDPAMRVRVREEVREILKAVGTPSILVTHDQDEALSLGDRVAVMLDGKIDQVGTPEDVYAEPTTEAVAVFIGDPNVLDGTCEGGSVTFALGSAPGTGKGGSVRVMVRPEEIAVTEEGDIEAVVERVEYFGHDEVVTARLLAGTQIRLRRMPGGGIDAGDSVRLKLLTEPRIFPAP
jgi:iron(III) transport system ATP-binding protein